MAPEHRIVIDAGNTRIKVARFSDQELIETIVFSDWKAAEEFLQAQQVPMIISSVAKNYVDLPESVLDRKPLLLSSNTLLPITLSYDTPETLGNDRIAAAVGATVLFPNQACLIIDLGTCNNYDLIDADGAFNGGAISPGFEMRMKSMHHFTERLPDISSDWKNIPLIPMGKTTSTCLLSGAFQGLVYEIDGYIGQFDQEFANLNVILTGGHAPYFESYIKAHIFASPEIVLIGLNRILDYNEAS
ncbi:MAG: type III pantothenate kinase [Cyclobacteriaceae bacterium]|nr:type III pantothenate kinase [Cyclobacteriaceae bacterium HetDA_MAG_MS6]